MFRGKSTAILGLLVMLAGCSRRQPAPQAAERPQPQIAIDPATTGSISGVVELVGTPPQPAVIDMSSDPACALASKRPAFAESVIAHSGKVQNVFVYVKDMPGNYVVPRLTAPVVLDQAGCRYQPHVLGVETGQPLKVQNSDRTYHNVHPLALNNQSWNESQMPQQSSVHSFANPELMMAVVCNQHPWMKMYVNVVSNPYFAVSDERGRFSIRGLPPGDYTLEAVHETLGTRKAKVHIAPREKQTVQFSFAVR